MHSLGYGDTSIDLGYDMSNMDEILFFMNVCNATSRKGNTIFLL